MNTTLEKIALGLAVVAGSFAPAASAVENGGGGWTVAGSDRMDLVFEQSSAPRFVLRHMFYGPGWQGPNLGRIKALPQVKDEAVRSFQGDFEFTETPWSSGPALLRWDVDYAVRQTGPDQIEILYKVTPDRAFQFTTPKGKGESFGTLGPVLPPSPFFEGGACQLETEDGKNPEFPLPPGMAGTSGVKGVTLKTAWGMAFHLSFDPPVHVHMDNGEVRFQTVSSGSVAAGAVHTQKIVAKSPEALRFEPGNRMVDVSGWIPFRAEEFNDLERPSLLSMDDWQDKPAGKHGWVQMKKDALIFEKTGRPVKFWGVNPLKVDQSVNEEYLSKSAAMMARLGMNLARFHAFAKPHTKKWAHMLKIQDPDDGMNFHERHLALLDHGFAEMKKNGVYSSWSVFYGWTPTPADKGRTLHWDELQTMLRKPFPQEGSFYHVAGLLPDIQDLIVNFHVKLLNHVNPHTGLRYADDPALAILELQNEENIFLNVRELDKALANAPTYRRMFYERFAAWLKSKYGGREALAKAWGAALKADETIEAANITPFPGWYQGTPSQRVADQMHFLYTTQREYYQKFESAVRATGYRGVLVASCWQAADWVGHLYNVLSDRDIGIIDRHNYNRPNMDQPGTGLISAGFQSVLDRPFYFSEWAGGTRVGESLATPQVAIYGLGLQGWDASAQFAWDYPGALPYKSAGVNDTCNDFGSLSQYFALARMTRRGDVAEGKIVANRRVSLPALKTSGNVGFTEQFSLLGGANNKSFNAAVPAASLAAGRVALEFVEGPVEKPVIDETAAFIDKTSRVVRSNTGQLVWDYSGQGFFAVDTPGAKAVIGHAGGRIFDLGGVGIAPQTPFANIYVVALGSGETIASARRLLISATARMVDAGTVFDELGDRPLQAPEARKGPLMIEPVKAVIELRGKAECVVHPLDHGGRFQTPQAQVPVEKTGAGCSFTIDGATYRTVYYLVEAH